MFENYKNKEKSYSLNIGVDSVPAKKKVALVCCSNGLPMKMEPQIQELVRYLRDMELEPVLSPYIYTTDAVEAGTACQRADILMEYYRDPEITEIYDISGGDIANEILPYLDYDIIANSDKIFWGYSDLTTILNAIYTKTGRPSVLYQVRNLLCEECELSTLFHFDYDWIQGKPKQDTPLCGIVVGGNIRCLLKLAGTSYWPDMADKILLLEARSGGLAQMTTYLSQLWQMGAFGQIKGILLGTFTQMEREQMVPDLVELVRRFAGEQIPIAQTTGIGHGRDSKAIVIGEQICLG